MHSSSPLSKSLCSLKDQLVIQLRGIPETIATLYDWYQGLVPKGSTVSWHSVVWEQWSLYRYRFILWLAVIGKLRTRDRFSFLSTDTICILCNRELNPMLTYFSVVIGLLSYGVISSIGFAWIALCPPFLLLLEVCLVRVKGCNIDWDEFFLLFLCT